MIFLLAAKAQSYIGFGLGGELFLNRLLVVKGDHTTRNYYWERKEQFFTGGQYPVSRTLSIYPGVSIAPTFANAFIKLGRNFSIHPRWHIMLESNLGLVHLSALQIDGKLLFRYMPNRITGLFLGVGIQYEYRWDVTQRVNEYDRLRFNAQLLSQYTPGIYNDKGETIREHQNTSYKTHKLYPMLSFGLHFDVSKNFAIQLEGQGLISSGYTTPTVHITGYKNRSIGQAQFTYGTPIKFKALISFIFFTHSN